MPRKKAPSPSFGHYRLRHEVFNPDPDGRKKNDWRFQLKWLEGEQFLIVEEEAFLTADGPGTIVPMLTSLSGLFRLDLDDPRALALLPFLEELPLQAGEWLTVKGGGAKLAGAVLEELVAMGKLTLADLEAAHTRRFRRRRSKG